MTANEDKDKEQLTPELTDLRRRVVELATVDVERETIEEKLQKSEQRYTAISEAATDAIIVIDSKANIISWNKAAQTIFGYTESEILNKHLTILMPKQYRTGFQKGMDQLNSEDMPPPGGTIYEFPGRRKDGSQFTAEISIGGWKQGKEVFYVGIARDITESKRAEEALLESEKFNTSLLENAPHQIFAINPDTSIRYVNPAFENTNGWTLAEIVGMKAPYPWWPEEKKEEWLPGFLEAIKRNGGQGEVISQKKNGELYWIALNWSWITHKGKRLYMLANAIDITERRQMEEEIKLASEEWEKTFDAIDDVIYIRDKNYRLVRANKAYADFVNAKAGELIGKSCYEVVHQTNEPCLYCPHQKVFKTGKPVINELFAPSLEKHFQTIISPIIDEKGQVVASAHVSRDITESKQAVEALRESEERYRELAESITDIFFAFDGDLRYTYWNKASEELTGISAKDAIGKHLYNIFPRNENTARAEKAYQKVMRTKKPQHLVNEYYIRDKRYFFAISAYPVKDGLSVFVKDITKETEVENALRESEERYRALVNLGGSIGEAIIMLQDTKQGNAIQTFVSNEWPRITGYSRKELLGMSFFDLLHPRYRNASLTRHRRKMKGEIMSGLFEMSIVRKDGTEVPIEVTSAYTTYRSERANVAFVRDITERKQAEEKLRDATRIWMSLTENTSDFIIILDDTGRIQYINRVIPPYTADQVIGKTLFDFAVPEDHEIIHQALEKTFETGEPVSYESSVEYPTGTLWFDVTMIPITEEGKVTSAMTFNRNITERRQAEEREKELQQELDLSRRLASTGELAAGVAHEINNPLTGIIGFSERLLRKSADEEIKQDLEKIHSEAQRAARVVENLRTFARRREIKKEYLDVNEIMEKTLELRDYELRTGNIEIVVEPAASVPKINGDFVQIQQVFLNIILNAEQAMMEVNGGGKLTIKTQKIKDFVRISFTDDGPGIAAENLDRVFDPFFTTRGERGGTGLGLSACHGIVSEHSGRIYTKSKPGKGTTFFIELPETTEIESN